MDCTDTDAQKKVEEFESRYQSLKQEFKDFIETTRRNEDLKRKEIQSDIAKRVLVVADSLCRMSDAASLSPGGLTGDALAAYQQNISAMYQQLLASCALSPLSPEPGTPFNDYEQIAVGIEYASRYPQDTVYSVIRKGYLRDGVLIRPAEVIISKSPRQVPMHNPGLWEQIKIRLFSPIVGPDQLRQEIDAIEHSRSEMMLLLEGQIQSIREMVNEISGDRESFDQTLEEQGETLEHLQEETARLKQALTRQQDQVQPMMDRIMYLEQIVKQILETPERNTQDTTFQRE